MDDDPYHSMLTHILNCHGTHMVRTMPAGIRASAVRWMFIDDLETSDKNLDLFSHGICPSCERDVDVRLFDCVNHWDAEHVDDCGATCCSLYEDVCEYCHVGWSFDMSA
jgi:hypothetical protein